MFFLLTKTYMMKKEIMSFKSNSPVFSIKPLAIIVQ